jgi:putative addiction module antidote
LIADLENTLTTLKLKAVGNSTGVILPKDILAKLRVERGDSLYVLETPNGIELTPYDPEFEQQMETARNVMKKRRGVLRELAK